MTVYKGLASFELVVVVTTEIDRGAMLGKLQQFAAEYFEVKSSQVAPGRLVIAVSTVNLCQWRLKVNNRF